MPQAATIKSLPGAFRMMKVVGVVIHVKRNNGGLVMDVRSKKASGAPVTSAPLFLLTWITTPTTESLPSAAGPTEPESVHQVKPWAQVSMSTKTSRFWPVTTSVSAAFAVVVAPLASKAVNSRTKENLSG